MLKTSGGKNCNLNKYNKDQRYIMKKLCKGEVANRDGVS